MFHLKGFRYEAVGGGLGPFVLFGVGLFLDIG